MKCNFNEIFVFLEFKESHRMTPIRIGDANDEESQQYISDKLQALNRGRKHVFFEAEDIKKHAKKAFGMTGGRLFLLNEYVATCRDFHPPPKDEGKIYFLQLEFLVVLN